MNLITGHKGYIGFHLMPQPWEGWTGCDLKDGMDYRSIHGETFDTVIHLAASVSVTESVLHPKEYMANNALGVAEFCRTNTIGRFIFVSTGGAMYGNRHLAREDQTSNLSDLTPYAQSKLLAERFVQVYQPNHVILRLANVFGGDYSVRGEAAVHAHFAYDDPLELYGASTRDFVDVHVVSEAIRRSLVLGHGIYNIGSGKEQSIADLAHNYSEMREVDINYHPARPGEVDYISLDCTRAKNEGLL